MSAAHVVLLAGVFAPPLVLLTMGHAYRHRSPRARGAFWGGVVGYGAGLVIAAAAMLVPAVDWTDGSPLRAVVVHAGPLAGCTVGQALGWALAAARRENSHP
ncbi:MAG TPA: hypothetical protein VLH75_17130 [Longimicrobiales bacterium]|nr:hypothetical protein [Longimicrobiales bacterium]